jgi:uncharacterized protein YjbI with pentapeptide repeats
MSHERTKALETSAIAPEKRLVDGPRQDFTYTKFSDLEIDGHSYRQSLFIGAIIQRCRFRAVSFERCDFSGVRFVDCAFENCSFSPDELRSCELNNCTFDSCNFRGSQWTKIQVRLTHFSHCNFMESSIRDCEFHSASFKLCQFKKSSLTQTTFGNTHFEEVDLGNCTALFLFLSDCHFSRCSLNAESVGFTYGLTEANIDELGLLYLGRRQRKPKGVDVVDALIANYWERRWYLGACALELNFRRCAPLLSIRRATDSIKLAAAKGAISDWDEVLFFAQILQILRGQERLPLLSLWSFVGALHEISSSATEQEAIKSPLSPCLQVTGLARALLMEMLDQVVPFIWVGTTQEAVYFELQLHRRPRSPLSKIVPSEIINIFGEDIISLVSERPGSWIENWQMGLAGLAAVQVSLAAVNGVLKQLVDIKKNSKRLKNEPAPRQSKPKKLPAVNSQLNPSTNSKIIVPIIIESEICRHEKVSRELSVERLNRLEALLSKLESLPESRIIEFLDYSEENIEKAAISRSSRSRPVKVHRARPPAA